MNVRLTGDSLTVRHGCWLTKGLAQARFYGGAAGGGKSVVQRLERERLEQLITPPPQGIERVWWDELAWPVPPLHPTRLRKIAIAVRSTLP